MPGHVLTATEAAEIAPTLACQLNKPGRIELPVDDATTTLAVPDWFRP